MTCEIHFVHWRNFTSLFTCSSSYLYFFSRSLMILLTTSWKKFPLYCPFKIIMRAFLKILPRKGKYQIRKAFFWSFKALEFRAWLPPSLKKFGPCSVSWFVSSAVFLPQLSMISRESSCYNFQNFTSLPVHGWSRGYPEESASIPFLSVQFVVFCWKLLSHKIYGIDVALHWCFLVWSSTESRRRSFTS